MVAPCVCAHLPVAAPVPVRAHPAMRPASYTVWLRSSPEAPSTGTGSGPGTPSVRESPVVVPAPSAVCPCAPVP
jgi:hypothetical protein